MARRKALKHKFSYVDCDAFEITIISSGKVIDKVKANNKTLKKWLVKQGIIEPIED